MWSLIPSRAERRSPPVRPSRTLFFCLVGAFLLTVLPHVAQLPLWAVVAVGAGMIFRSIGEFRRWRLPSPIFCGLLALCLLAAIFFQFGTIFGRDAGTAFMVTLLTIKFFELRGPRDLALIIFCSFFVVMSSLLYSQDIELFLYCLFMMWVLTALLLRTSMGDLPDNHLAKLLGTAGLIFLQALPLSLFLFFLFPRYHGVLQLGSDENSIGLTDKVEPGSISRLAEDDSTAMMVKINTPGILTPEALYWRAMVLWDYANGAWTPGLGAAGDSKDPSSPLPRTAPGSSIMAQVVTIYPHFHHWLFALDYPTGLAEAADGTAGFSRALNGGVLTLKGDDSVVNRKELYTVTSSSLLAPQVLSPEQKKAALALPNGKDDQIDPRIRDLAAQLHRGCRTDDDYIRSVLHYFRREHFRYSDEPGARGKDALADFLLKSRIGFCEHYASAFAVLMRLGQVPTRLVVGYQGAQYNPYKNIYVVKQSNAHSWDEVWIDSEKYWRRVDPTAILSGGEMLTGAGGRTGESLSIDVADHRFTLISEGSLPGWVSRALLETQLRRQEVEADWNDWIFSYDTESQWRLAQALGFRHQPRTVLGLACIAAVLIFGTIFGLAMKRRVKVSPVENFYAKFCRSMAQRGAPRAPWEGPLAYTDRMAEAFPEDRASIAEAGKIVAQARYGDAPPAVDHSELKSLLLSLTASGASASPRNEG